MPARQDRRPTSIRLMARVSHGRLYVGSCFTTVKQGELSRGLVAAMLRQLKIDREDF